MSKKIIWMIICLIGFCGLGWGQGVGKKIISLGVVNDKAKILPMPKMPAPRPHIVGNLNVQVKIDLQKGEVIEATAISGHPLTWVWIEIAARQAKFEPILTEFDTIYGSGILTYKLEDFNGKTIENKKPKPLLLVVSGGIANKKAKHLPKPVFPKGCRCEGTINVKVLIDMDGNVIRTKTSSGNPLLQASAIQAARKAKFSPTLINGPRIFVKATLVYKFKPNGKVEM